MTNKEPTEFDFTQEVRFAVVMYGGISLAIYMNGVAQELLKLVRATAPDPDNENKLRHSDDDLVGTERVYRKLGRMLSRVGEVRDPEKVGSGDPITTRFVVDILSGSSAGGINAVYLAKALANDQKMDKLKDLWIEEGDIENLINDRRPVRGLAKQDPPQSLLNSRRMYWKLLDALEEMEKGNEGNPSRNGGARSPNVEELDLYVTATDMKGQPVNLQLADKLVAERRHRNVFHFRYSAREYDHDNGSDVRNDFLACNNPFLAFAARCTSAHPAAFEPMKLGDIDEVLNVHPRYDTQPHLRSDTDKWRKFYKDYLRSEDTEDKFTNRCFNDGGVLDNRPFSYALDAIPTHFARMPVDRKLLYIEPTPELIRQNEQKKDGQEKDGQKPPPSFVENVWSSLSDLPRYEPIREDLQRVLERNRLIDRVNDMFKGTEDNIMALYALKDRKTTGAKKTTASSGEESRLGNLVLDTSEKWDDTGNGQDKTLTDMVREKGLAWGSYQRLRVAEVTDDLARLIVRIANLDEDSDEFVAVRQLVRRWRKSKYHAEAKAGDKDPEYEFLRRFDFAWRLRRLRFVLAKIEEMLSSDERAGEMVAMATRHNLAYGEIPDFRKALSSMMADLGDVDEDLDKCRRGLWEARDNYLPEEKKLSLNELVENIGLERQDLYELLKSREKEVRDRRIEDLINEKKSEFDKFSEEVQNRVGEAFKDASEKCVEILPPDPPDNSTEITHIARKTVRVYYDTFINYDMVSYPIMQAAGIGEEIAQVEVFRVSPNDASQLIEDTREKPKLAGTRFNNFGAFFKKEFRDSDIMWGQLDGAERIISVLLPHERDEGKRTKLIEEAHEEIIKDKYKSEFELLVAGLDKYRKSEDSKKANEKSGKASKELVKANEKTTKTLARFLDDGPQSVPDNDRLKPLLQAYLNVAGNGASIDLREHFKKQYDNEYESNRKFDNRIMVHSAARASRVFGKMLEDYSETQRRLPNKGLIWVTRITQLFWSLVEVAVPGSVWNLVFNHWIKLLYSFEALLIVLGTLLFPSTQQLGLIAFAITVTLHAAILFLGDFMGGGKGAWRVFKFLFALLVAILSVIGSIFLFVFVAFILNGSATWDWIESGFEVVRGMSGSLDIFLTQAENSLQESGISPLKLVLSVLFLSFVLVLAGAAILRSLVRVGSPILIWLRGTTLWRRLKNRLPQGR